MTLEEFTKTYVVRYDELSPAPGAPADAALPRFTRERLIVLGRPGERAPGAPAPALNTGINMGYARCEPGKGFAAHKHPGWEVFLPLSGRWRISLESSPDIEIGQWDVVTVPGDVFHGAVNISDQQACLMSINPGADAQSHVIAPDVALELARKAVGDGEG